MVVFNIKAGVEGDYNNPVSADYWTGRSVNFNELDQDTNINALKSNADLNAMFKDIASFQYEPVWEALPNDSEDFIGAATTTNPIPNVEFRQIGVIELLSGNKILAFESEIINELTGDANDAKSFLGQVGTRLKDVGDPADIRDKILNTVSNPVPFLTCFGYVITRNLLTQYNTNTNSSQIRIGVVFVQESSVQE